MSDCNNLLDAHRAYMRRDRKADKPDDNDEFFACEECGCPGNNKCGHECLDTGNMFCALDDDMVCPCCKAVWEDERKNKGGIR